VVVIQTRMGLPVNWSDGVFGFVSNVLELFNVSPIKLGSLFADVKLRMLF
jgi:hypothetical protein